jgi:ubiquinone/menaquinone biosynthesis C-methylase UbiE
MNRESNPAGMYTPDSEFAYGEDIIGMITYLNKFSGLENFMNIGYADSLIEYLLYPVGLSSKRLPQRLARPLLKGETAHESILVVGCGRGGEAVLLHELTGANIIGVDITPFNIKSAQEYAKKNGLVHAVTFLVGDACELPVDSGSVSCVFSCESAFHYKDKGGFIDESYRVLKEGGYLLIADIVRKLPQEKLLENEIQTLREFGRMLSAPEFFSLEEYKKHIKSAGFLKVIDCEVISKHNIGYLAAYSGRLIKMFTLLDKLPGFKGMVKSSFKKKHIDIENFIEHSRTTAEAVRMKLVDYIIIGAQK